MLGGGTDIPWSQPVRGAREPGAPALRPIEMSRRIIAVLCGALLLGGCARSAGSPGGAQRTRAAVAAEFVPACGQPGATVVVLAVPVTVRHADCDLVGVELHYGLATAVVPASGRVERHVETYAPTSEPIRIVITVADGTGDVTVTG